VPEGPEVKLFVDKLKSYENKIVSNITFLSGRFLKKQPDISMFVGKSFDTISCKGKFIWFESEDNVIFNTLGMTGSWGTRLGTHSRIQISFEDNSNIFFNDIRSFGTFQVKTKEDLKKKLKTIGPDMLSAPVSFNDFLSIMRKKSNKNICEAIMSQNIISGVGNYIKAESLWLSRIYPFAKIKDLTDDHLKLLYYAILFVINASYKSQGATLQTYYTFDDEKGSYVDNLYVYGRKKDFNGFIVIKDETPDKRTTHYVKERQINGLIQNGEE